MSDTYNGWTNRATWAMALNLGNDYGLYQSCEERARYAAVGNEDDPDGFHAELAVALEKYGRYAVAEKLLPDFDPDLHESPYPEDNNGPDNIDEVDWSEIAESYPLHEYV